MGCISGISKYLLFFFNFCIVVCGVVLIAIGAVLLVNEYKGLDSVTDYSVGGFAIAVGAIIFCIAFFGCCGAIKENKCLLLTYAIILIVLLVLQVVLGALAFVAVRNDDNSFDKTVHDAIKDVFDKYFNDTSDTDQKDIVDSIQSNFKCCGIDSKNDWIKYGGPPKSCFEDKNTKKDIFEDGCATAFQDFLEKYVKVIGGVAIGFAAVELVGAILAFIVRSRH